MHTSATGRSGPLRLLAVRRERIVQKMSRVDRQLAKTQQQMIQIEQRIEALVQARQQAA